MKCCQCGENHVGTWTVPSVWCLCVSLTVQLKPSACFLIVCVTVGGGGDNRTFGLKEKTNVPHRRCSEVETWSFLWKITKSFTNSNMFVLKTGFTLEPSLIPRAKKTFPHSFQSDKKSSHLMNLFSSVLTGYFHRRHQKHQVLLFLLNQEVKGPLTVCVSNAVLSAMKIPKMM